MTRPASSLVALHIHLALRAAFSSQVNWHSQSL